ncbi:hypothetical protein LUW74_43775 [Actinomadura madurae]|uniref:hypothetical protein n=1 Tax=Actinomadura madurae TaxID=1993 RepID=UPI002026A398|nr:hypothetical protein [Actinomadura madurae]URN09595.1 hypothetical protein LUW74_43775 [Actinomadura madurae]
MDGLPTVRLGPDPLDEAVTPDVVSVIRYAIRLRMVPPRSPRDALSAFVRIAAMRRRSDDRFPFLSTGRESMPVGKDGEDQGIDLELLRRRAARYRKEQRAGRAGGPELVPPVPVPARNRRIAEANAHDVRAVMRLLGVSGGDEGVWPCPRSRNHPAGDRAPSLRVSGDNRVRCRHCDSEKIGAVRLVADALGLTPDEAAAVVLGSP